MADSQPDPQIAADTPLQTQTYAEPRAHHPHGQPRKPPGPQLWAVVLTLGGLYYLWTRVLGKSLPGFRGGQRVGAKGHGGGRQAEIQAARERQQQRLQTANRAREMTARQAKGGGVVRERPNATSSGNNPAPTIREQQELLRNQKEERQRQQELEEKKKKQRQLYLKQKAAREKEEEMRKKDEELGPGWRYREDPDAAANAVNGMDPQSDGGGGGYKPQSCTRRGG